MTGINDKNFDELLQVIQAKAAADSSFKKLCLENPFEAVKLATDLELPAGLGIRFTENTQGTLTILMPPPDEELLELDETELNQVAGGRHHNVLRSVGHAFSSAAHEVAHVATESANTVAHTTTDAANTVAHTATDAANTVAHASTDAANAVAHTAVAGANETAHISVQVADTTAHISEKVGDHVATDVVQASHQLSIPTSVSGIVEDASIVSGAVVAGTVGGIVDGAGGGTNHALESAGSMIAAGVIQVAVGVETDNNSTTLHGLEKIGKGTAGMVNEAKK